AVPSRYVAQDGAKGGVGPGLRALGAEASRQVGRASAYGEDVRRAAVTGLVHLEGALVDQDGRAAFAQVQPAERQGDGDALLRDLELTVVIAEHDLQLVRI